MTLAPDEIERRQFAIARAIQRAEIRAAVIPFVVATACVGLLFVALARAGLRDMLSATDLLIGVAVFMPVSLLLSEASLPQETRAAIETFHWIGRWEWLRLVALAGDPPLDRDEAVAWLDAHPDPGAPGWVEVRVRAGDLQGARASAAALPTATAWDRFERAEMLAWVDWVACGPGDLAEASRAATDLDDPDEQLRAAAMLATIQARIDMYAGGDWRGPLARLRPRIGDQARNIRRHTLVRRLSTNLVIAVAVSAILGFVAGRA